MHTRLLYLESLDVTTAPATIIAIQQEETNSTLDNASARTILLLDQTVFYPQGGGQPYDQGTISSETGSLHVEEARFVDGIVKHIGQVTSGTFAPGDAVTCTVDVPRRALHSRLHSAGHVIDMAIVHLKLTWQPAKAYHFPAGAYVEYAGALPEQEREALLKKIESICNELLAQDLKTRLAFVSTEEMHNMCHFTPDNLPADKPARVVLYGDFGIPCGGTHVSHLAQIGKIVIRKLKMEKGMIRVSYAIE